MPEPTSPNSRARRGVFAGAGILLIGALLAVAGTQARPGPRLSRKDRLVDLIRAEDARTRGLRSELEQLKSDLAALERGQSSLGRQLAGLRRSAGALAPFAGLSPVRGPGVRVTLRDSTLRTSPSGDPNDLVIHEQDLQAVVNALWGTGAEAIAINGERITAASAIRCVGNTLLLHGSVYSPPYRIAAIGDADRLGRGLDGDPLVERFRIVVEEFRLGFEVRRESRLEVPAFRGVIASRFAAPSGSA